MSTDGINDNSGTQVLPALALDADQFLKHEYDFIIVGGGTAGLAIAARLTENPNVTVGVLEAGKNKLDDFLVDTPGMFTQLLGNEEYDWNFKTVSQSNGKTYHIPRGKILGGSSGINFMMYVRGSTQDYDDWAILADDPSWGSEKMDHYMRKHQTLDPIDEHVAHRTTMRFVAKNHGTSGPVHTSFNDSLLPIEDNFQRGFDQVTGIVRKPMDPYVSENCSYVRSSANVATQLVWRPYRRLQHTWYRRTCRPRHGKAQLCRSRLFRCQRTTTKPPCLVRSCSELCKASR